jgi:hypothetical protein
MYIPTVIRYVRTVGVMHIVATPYVDSTLSEVDIIRAIPEHWKQHGRARRIAESAINKLYNNSKLRHISKSPHHKLQHSTLD